MTSRCELRLTSPASLDRPKSLRHALAAFLTALQLDGEAKEDVLTAVGEALANAVEHAYDGRTTGTVELFARTDEEARLLVDVCDSGVYIDRERTTDRGFGLRIIRAIARAVSVERDGGTRVRMVFDFISQRAAS